MASTSWATIKIAGIAGSLRAQSYNRALLREAARLVPASAELEILEIGELPLYNQDLELDPPEVVRRFKERLRAADAVLIATPEYNYSVPGVLKNALDWASRPPGDSALAQKPLAIVGASGGNFGTVRAQLHLRHIAVNLDMYPVNKPEVLIAQAHTKFDASGRLQDPVALDLLRQLLERLVEWTLVLRRGREALAVHR